MSSPLPSKKSKKLEFILNTIHKLSFMPCLIHQEILNHENKIYPLVEMKKAQFVTMQTISTEQLNI
jgi:hypothetical protein